ncbi:MAG: hypothetical protein V4557_14780 [Bacteroidota bacterium]
MKNILQELRIGNWLFSEGKFFCITTELFYHMLSRRTIKYEPIRITPEILGCAGFTATGSFFQAKKMIEGVVYDNVNLDPSDEYWFSYYFNLCEVAIMSENQSIVEPLVIIKEVYYLHQLQNLIYSLTGVEMKIEFHKGYTE